VVTDGRAELREFVGFVWQEGFRELTGVLVMATDVSEAAAVVKEANGEGFGVSVWNEEDAARSR
jgi:hypothetical protein